jgi:hypothetical protein
MRMTSDGNLQRCWLRPVAPFKLAQIVRRNSNRARNASLFRNLRSEAYHSECPPSSFRRIRNVRQAQRAGPGNEAVGGSNRMIRAGEDATGENGEER